MRFAGKTYQYADLLCLIGAFILLLIAASRPSVQLTHQQKSYLFIVDITQSMNVEDMRWDGKPLTRLEYTKELLKESIKALPCNAKVGLGVFFKTTSALLYTPIEVCQNYNILWDTIDHLNWRMASQGNSNIRLGLLSTASMLSTSDVDFAHIVFLTDGQEAPPLNVFSKTSLSSWQDPHSWTVVGVGASKASPIPKLDSHNNVIGYWSTDAIKLNPASNVDEGHKGGRDNSIATEPYEYYLSHLDESYLKELTTEIGAQYIRAGTSEQLLYAIQTYPSHILVQTRFALDQIFALIALLLVTAIYMPEIIIFIKKLRHFYNRNKPI